MAVYELPSPPNTKKFILCSHRHIFLTLFLRSIVQCSSPFNWQAALSPLPSLCSTPSFRNKRPKLQPCVFELEYGKSCMVGRSIFSLHICRHWPAAQTSSRTRIESRVYPCSIATPNSRWMLSIWGPLSHGQVGTEQSDQVNVPQMCACTCRKKEAETCLPDPKIRMLPPPPTSILRELVFPFKGHQGSWVQCDNVRVIATLQSETCVRACSRVFWIQCRESSIFYSYCCCPCSKNAAISQMPDL